MRYTFEKIRMLIMEIAGWILVLAGIAALVLPGPGILMLFAGLVLLSARYDWADRQTEPVKKLAVRAARENAGSLLRTITSLLIALSFMCVGVIWGLGPDSPSWWPLDDKFWLFGGWGVGATMIASGFIAVVLIIFSYVYFRRDNTVK